MSLPNTPRREPIRVLAVDDDPIQRNLIRARLQRLHAHTTEAADGVIAWDQLRQQAFDLAIIDLSMPNLDGIGLIQCMRGHPRTRHMPIIVVTSRTDTGAIEESLRAGASSFLVKPVVWSTFEHHVGFLMELVRSNRDARRAAHRMSAASRAKDAIIGGLFGNAASSARSILEQVQHVKRTEPAEATEESLRDCYALIETESRAVLDSAQRALATLHLLERQLIVDDRSVLISDIVSSVLRAVQPEADQRSITINAVLPDQPAVLKCEQDSIELALMRLVENAVEHSPPGSTVGLTATQHPDGMISLEVADNGPGMEQGQVLRYLAPLLADDAEFEGVAPMGFGLLLAKAIVEAHDGKLEIRSQIGSGTSAMLILPAERCSALAEVA